MKPVPAIRTTSSSLAGLLGWLALVFVTATVGAIASVEAASFYAQLARPAWAPPGWVFGPVWTLLYLMMGFAAWQVWRTRGFARARLALGLFCLQLAVNALWSWLFFAWHLGALAFAEVLLLWGLVLATVVSFWRASRLAGILLLPYLAWVSFASVLTYTVWQMNPSLLV